MHKATIYETERAFGIVVAVLYSSFLFVFLLLLALEAMPRLRAERHISIAQCASGETLSYLHFIVTRPVVQLIVRHCSALVPLQQI
jgi:hypothetical protein